MTRIGLGIIASICTACSPIASGFPSRDFARLVSICWPAISEGRSLDPARVIAAPAVWPTPQTLPPNAPPRIITVWMNATTIRPGRVWIGKIITSTNVASVEVRTESFSFSSDHRGPGLFDFSQDILDVVPQYRRSYVLRLIARNTPGEADERDVPITIR